METKIYQHKKLEKHPLLVRFLRLFTVPILNIIPPRIIKKIVVKSSPYGAKVLEKPGTTHSLETMYTKGYFNSAGIIKNLSNFFWHNVVSQPKAVRNRLRIIEDILESELKQQIINGESIHIYNLGGGSSRAIITTVSKFSVHNLVTVTTIDRDAKALQKGREIAKEYNVGSLFNWVQGDVREIDKFIDPNSAEIIEMVGLLDYFDFPNSIELIKKIYSKLKPGGVFIVANVHPNPESQFVQNVGWPKMHYKTTDELAQILHQSGFNEEYISLSYEPLLVHLIAVARK
jgi:SAM-dependent methyltransferase